MIMLVGGVLLWSALHLLPVTESPIRTGLIDKIGATPYRGLFALGIVASIVLMVLGWRSIEPAAIYTPPEFGKPLTSLFLLGAFILLGAAKSKSSIRHYVRHPMLTAVILWSVGHLTSNGDIRSVVLFVGLGLWAAVMIVLTNKRDGHWDRPEKIPFKQELKGLFISLVVYVVVVLLHPYFAGVSPAPH